MGLLMKCTVELTDVERHTLQQLSLNHRHRDFRIRATGLLLRARGLKVQDVARELEVSCQTVYSHEGHHALETAEGCPLPSKASTLAPGSRVPLSIQGLCIKPNLVYIRFERSDERRSHMRLADHVKPISYLKSDAAQIVKDLTASGEPLLITQNGEARLVVQDVQSYEDTQQTLALLKILALGQRDIEQGKFKDADAFLAELDDLDRKEQIG